MAAPALVTPPAALITLAEAKAFLRVDHDDDDAVINALLAAAVAHFDGWSGTLGRCLVSQVWRITQARFPAGSFRLPFPDITSVSITWFDEANTAQSWGPEMFFIQRGGWVHLLSVDVPAVFDRPDAVSITFTAGFGAAADVPAPLKAAALFKLADMFNQRVGGNGNEQIIASLVTPYRWVP